ncbi:GspH/FimT family pseudopilin [Alteromonas sp. A079]|uniref:GspH/FimT family pseudopilin n=1 Tax=Alteromonas sp. A079 TaxID=3410268 RepID=UPI003BA1211D
MNVHSSPFKYQRGLTLLELLVTITILGILLTVVAPNIQSILIKNRITGDVNTLSAVAQRARFTAVDEQTNVTLCPTSNYTSCVSDWKRAKMVFIDSNGNGSRENSEVLIASSDPMHTQNTISGITGAITFDEQGAISTQASIIICPSSGESSYASALLLSLYGRIAIAIDSDGDNVKEDLAGNALSCS